MAGIEGMNSLRGMFEDPPELFLIKGGRWNQASTFINIFLGLISSTILVVQQSEPIVVCLNSASNKTTNLGSNYAYAEEECEGQMLEDFPASMFHKYIGWVFTVQIILMVMWSRIWIGGNRILIEQCIAFSQLMESFTNVTGHMTDEERKDLWINQDYLQRSSKMLFAEMRTKTNIKDSKQAQMKGRLVLSSLFSIFNICVLHFTNTSHKDVAECQLAADAHLTCQFTAFDFIFILAAIFTGILLLELIVLIREAWEFIHETFENVKPLYDRINNRPHAMNGNLTHNGLTYKDHNSGLTEIHDFDFEPIPRYKGKKTGKPSSVFKRLRLTANGKVGNGKLNVNQQQLDYQASIPNHSACDLFYITQAMHEIHGTAMTFLFLSVTDEKIKLSWAYEKTGETWNSISLGRKDPDFWKHVKNTLIQFNMPPQVFFRVKEVKDSDLINENIGWKMIKKVNRDLGGIDWFDDPVQIDLRSYFGTLFPGSNPPMVKLTAVVVWNKRQIWEGDFTFEGNNACEEYVPTQSNYDHSIPIVHETLETRIATPPQTYDYEEVLRYAQNNEESIASLTKLDVESIAPLVCEERIITHFNSDYDVGDVPRYQQLMPQAVSRMVLYEEEKNEITTIPDVRSPDSIIKMKTPSEIPVLLVESHLQTNDEETVKHPEFQNVINFAEIQSDEEVPCQIDREDKKTKTTEDNVDQVTTDLREVTAKTEEHKNVDAEELNLEESAKLIAPITESLV